MDGLEAGPASLLGEAGKGLAHAIEALDLGRTGIAAQAVGVGRAACGARDTLCAGAGTVRSADCSLRGDSGEVGRNGEAYSGRLTPRTRRSAAISAANHGAGHSRTGADGVTSRAAIAKLAASEAATWFADEAVQVFGGYGYVRHYPVERLLRDAKGTEIYEGTNEIMRHVIAREVLRDAAQG